jgi:putative transposase
METRRCKAPPEAEVAYHHCLSRVVNREWHFSSRGREKFLEVFRGQAAFTGVWILPFRLRSNHLRILPEAPRRPVSRWAEEE